MSWLDLSAYYIMAGATSDRLEALARPVKNDFPRRIDRVIDYFGGDGSTTAAARAPRRGHAKVSPHAAADPGRARRGQRRRESRAATKAAEKTKTTAE
jgi:hypothetical protein